MLPTHNSNSAPISGARPINGTAAEAAPTPRSVRRPGKLIWAGRSRSLLTVPAYAEMGGVEFRMHPARQIQQLATARQRRSKRTGQQRATTPGAAFGDSGGRGV